MGSEENVCPQAWGGRGAVLREVRQLAARPPPGVKLLAQDDLTRLTAELAGPPDTPYEGGAFRVRLALDGGYPARPPRAAFETRVFHPNVSPAGEVCVSTLARDWRPALGLAHALVAVRALLLQPNPESALNEEAAALLRADPAAFRARARLYTDIHARPHDARPPPQEKEASGSGAAAEGPSEPKRERRAAAAAAAGPSGAADAGDAADAPRTAAPRAPRPKPDKRRILKRL